MVNAALLSPADIGVIRRYVQTKYAPLSEDQRADIVATAIRQTLQRRLPDLPEDMKGRIADDLIRRCLLGERRDVMPDDVLDVCAEIELPDPAMEYLILEPVLKWMNERAPGEWNPERLVARLFKRGPAALLIPEAGLAEASAAIEEPAAIPTGRRLWPFAGRKIPRPAWVLGIIVLAGGIGTGLAIGGNRSAEPIVSSPSPSVVMPQPVVDIGMPAALQYREIDAAAIKAFLRSRESMLADEPYFGAIVVSAREHDVNPLLLFAITGQEQGFVPKTSKNAKKIANNPFNVFHSWEEFNTDISHSADIAARTISRRGEKRPEKYEPFDWLNQTYAEDPNWAEGVKQIFSKLEQLSPAPTNR